MKKWLYFLTMGLLLLACSNSTNPYDETVGSIAIVQDIEDKSVNVLTSPIVSDPANDPYTVENMNRAMRQRILAKSAASVADVEQMSLEPNYLYVRFLAEGKRGVAELKAYDTSLVLFKHPLDYKHIRKPVVYIDPVLPDTIISLFATIPKDYKFGPTKYEVIKELFLVEPLDGDCEKDDCVEELDSATTEKTLLKRSAQSHNSPIFERLSEMGISLHEIEWESIKMTDNFENRLKRKKREIGELPAAAWSLFGGGKKYGGQLKFKDDVLGTQYLEGVRVIGGYSYYWREAHTDEEGKFKIPEKWNFNIDYEANFDDQEFLLEDGHSSYGEDLEIEKNDMSGDWKQTFAGDTAKWCAVWTAAYQYWHGNRYNLKKPRTNTAGNMSLDIEVYYKNDGDFKTAVEEDGTDYNKGMYGYYTTRSSDDRILIRAYKRASDGLYRSTIHEIAHFSLMTNQKSSILNAEDENYRNAYTRGIEWFFTNRRYCPGDLNAVCGIHYEPHYIGIVQDLIDDEGAIAGYGGNEKVSGFKIIDVENAFFASKNLDEVRSYILDKLPSGKDGRSYTKTNLKNLFEFWKEWL